MKKILNVIGKRAILLVVLACFVLPSVAQVKSATIEFERRTNVYKLYKDNKRMERMMDYIKDNKIKKDVFHLHFNDTISVFTPKPNPEEGWGAWLTQKNTTVQNFKQEHRTFIMDMWGSQVLVRDTLRDRQWKITYDKRKIAGYECRKAVWDMNDTTRIYAWYSDELEISTGPESFRGLPGTILGLATEDGGIVYFAKNVEITSISPEEVTPKFKEKDLKSEAEIRESLSERFGKMMGPDGDKFIDNLFAW